MIQNENMHRVALHLQKQAMEAPADQKDAFARSAYNRFYYSVFLQSREMMKQLDSKWSTLPHADYPKVLNGKVLRTFKLERRRAEKNRDRDLIKSIDQAMFSIERLRDIILAANVTRVVADYEPEEAIVFTAADNYSLSNIDVSDARGWTTQTAAHCRTILRAWNQFNA